MPAVRYYYFCSATSRFIPHNPYTDLDSSESFLGLPCCIFQRAKDKLWLLLLLWVSIQCIWPGAACPNTSETITPPSPLRNQKEKHKIERESTECDLGFGRKRGKKAIRPRVQHARGGGVNLVCLENNRNHICRLLACSTRLFQKKHSHLFRRGSVLSSDSDPQLHNKYLKRKGRNCLAKRKSLERILLLGYVDITMYHSYW